MKKVFIGVLAALMLFAFVACDNSGYQFPANVDYITMEQTGDFLVGDEFNAANFTVYAHDTNGGVTPVNGVSITCDELKSTTVAADTTYTAKASLKVAGSQTALEASCEFVGYEVESVEVAGAPELAVYSAPEAVSKTAVVKADGTAVTAKDYTNATYTLVYNGDSTRAVEFKNISKYVDFEAFVVLSDSTIVEGTEYPVVIRTSSDDYVKTNLTAVGVKEAPKAPEEAKPEQNGLTATVSEKSYLGQPTTVKIYQTFAGADNKEVTDLSSYVIVETSAGNKVVTTIPAAFDTTSHTYRITSPDNKFSTSVTIPAGQNYYKSGDNDVSVAPVALPSGETYKYGQPISGSNVNVTIATYNIEKNDDGQTLKYAVADKITSVELIGVENIPTKEALGNAPSFKASCRIVFTSMGVEKVVTKDVTFTNLA